MKERRFSNAMRRPLLILALVFLIAGTLFYWYEYRPSIVREICSAAAEKMSNKDEYVYEIVYCHCLRSHGIEYSERKE